VAGVRLKRRHLLDAPQGVRGRSSDNTLIRERLGWEPSTSLGDGIEATYRWIHDELATGRRPAPVATGRETRSNGDDAGMGNGSGAGRQANHQAGVAGAR
jgi:hypothetical protein